MFRGAPRRFTSLAAKGLQVAQVFSGIFTSSTGCGIEQHPPLIAILRNSVSLQKQVGQQKRRLRIPLGDRLPQPIDGFGWILLLPVGAIQVTPRSGQFFGAVS